MYAYLRIPLIIAKNQYITNIDSERVFFCRYLNYFVMEEAV